jgi:4'-phosphopantetheinyl transferase EntD
MLTDVPGGRDDAISVARALRALAPATVRTGCRAIDPLDWLTLHEQERNVVAGAVSKRRREFASGRVLLHELLHTADPILPDQMGAPMWPPGFCGSLAHDDVYAVAAVSGDPEVRALGIDIEPATPLSPALAEVIRRPDERHLDAHLVFTLKESVYKAWSALGGGMLEHADVRVIPHGCRFTAEVTGAAAPFAGRTATVRDHVVALVVVGREESAWT